MVEAGVHVTAAEEEVGRMLADAPTSINYAYAQCVEALRAVPVNESTESLRSTLVAAVDAIVDVKCALQAASHALYRAGQMASTD